MRVLLVEDHLQLAEAVADALRQAGLAVDHAATAAEARERAALADHALVLLDLDLPGGDGLRLLAVLRQGGRVPVIVLAARDDLADRSAGLAWRADDHVVKPVEMTELVARARALLRRPKGRSGAILRLGPLRLDTATGHVRLWDMPVVLGRRETAVLGQLMRRAGQVAPRQELEQALHTIDEAVTPKALETAVSRLRRALAAAGCPIPIFNVRGVGWMLPRKGAQ
jgi:DNA-binding response OmpR family regulator